MTLFVAVVVVAVVAAVAVVVKSDFSEKLI